MGLYKTTLNKVFLFITSKVRNIFKKVAGGLNKFGEVTAIGNPAGEMIIHIPFARFKCPEDD